MLLYLTLPIISNSFKIYSASTKTNIYYQSLLSTCAYYFYKLLLHIIIYIYIHRKFKSKNDFVLNEEANV